MDCLLIGIGIFGLLAATAVLGVVWFYKFRIKRWYVYGLAASINKFPGRVSLRRQEPFQWLKTSRAEQRAAAFRALGFTDIGGYLVDELPKARLFALWHAVHGLVGVVNEMEELGTWSDVLFFRAGQSQPILASSILKRSHFHLLPGDPKIHKPDAAPADLIEAVRTSAGTGVSAQNVTAENFAARFEQAFADATDARLLEPLEEYEIRRFALDRGQPCGNEITDKEFKLLKALLPLTIENELRLVCGAQFLRETSLAATEWQHATQRLLVVHDRTPLPRLAGHLIYGVFLTKELRGRLRRAGRSGAPREIFARLNESLPAWHRYKKLGEVARPVPADIYRAPIERKTA